MEIITSLGQLHKFSAPCVIALGTFDGLHRGHLDVICAAKKEAKLTGAKLAVFTFSNHPLALISPDKVPVALVTAGEKQQHGAKLWPCAVMRSKPGWLWQPFLWKVQ